MVRQSILISLIAIATADLRLPPVPYIETMPWLMDGSAAQGSKVDMLWSPKLDHSALS